MSKDIAEQLAELDALNSSDEFKTEKKTISYPFMFIDNIYDVELKSWMHSGVVQNNNANINPEKCLSLYEKCDEGYLYLGEIEFSLKTLLVLNEFKEHKLFIKKSKSEIIEVDNNILTSMLLER